MRFIADSMLGRLARWLRLLGFDTLYYPRIEDRVLLKTAREENRMLLTRDTRLVKMRGLKDFLLLKENDPFDQLKNVIASFDLVPDINELCETRLLSRCSLCNNLLDNVSKELAKEHVPEYVYLTSESFSRCANCEKFYWKGTHPELLKKKLMEILYN
jgi:uncharacterized protein with PIN domain